MAVRGPDEDDDWALVAEVVFEPHGLALTRFSDDEIGLGPTPDFQVFHGDAHVAYCELKSPRDDAIDELLADAAPGQFVELMRNDPTFNRIARHVAKAAGQFTAVNHDHVLPNVLAFVNHDRGSSYADLREVLTGYFFASDGERYPTMLHISDGRISAAKHEIDLFAWVDSRTRRLQGYIENRASPHISSVRAMFGLNGQIE